ncbi:MAG: hypothetical protein ABI240_14030, partial [Sphingomonas sp.]
MSFASISKPPSMTRLATGSFLPRPQHKRVAAAFLSAHGRPDGHDFDLQTLICLPGQEAKFYPGVDALLLKSRAGISTKGHGCDLPVLQLQPMAAIRLTVERLGDQTGARRFADDDLARPTSSVSPCSPPADRRSGRDPEPRFHAVTAAHAEAERRPACAR